MSSPPVSCEHTGSVFTAVVVILLQAANTASESGAEVDTTPSRGGGAPSRAGGPSAGAAAPSEHSRGSSPFSIFILFDSDRILASWAVAGKFYEEGLKDERQFFCSPFDVKISN